MSFWVSLDREVPDKGSCAEHRRYVGLKIRGAGLISWQPCDYGPTTNCTDTSDWSGIKGDHWKAQLRGWLEKNAIMAQVCV